MHAEFHDELPEQQSKAGWERGVVYDQLMVIKDIGRKYAKLTMGYPGEYVSDASMRAAIHAVINYHDDLKSIFKVKTINGEIWLIRTDI